MQKAHQDPSSLQIPFGKSVEIHVHLPCVCVCVCVCVLIAQSFPTICDPLDCSPPGSSIHEIPQARILQWVAIPFSRGSSRPQGSNP